MGKITNLVQQQIDIQLIEFKAQFQQFLLQPVAARVLAENQVALQPDLGGIEPFIVIWIFQYAVGMEA